MQLCLHYYTACPHLKILKECIKWLQFTNPKNDTNSNDRKSNATKIDTGPDKGQP
jgi:hypothetical protein